MTTSTDSITWQALYNACTLEERQEIIFLMLAKVEARRRASLALLMVNTKQLANLPASRLREVVSVGLEDAHAWIANNFPQAADVLAALECLTAFSLSKDEPTANDLLDAISSLEAVWKVAGGNYAADLLKTSTVGSKASPPARSVAVETEGRAT